MKVFSIADLNNYGYTGRSGTQGYQAKFIKDNLFIKQQLILNGQPRKDWKVEIFASKLGEILNIPVIKQEHCKIAYPNYTLDGVASENLEETCGLRFCSFKYLAERRHKDISILNKLGTVDKFKFIAHIYEQATGISYEEALKYMIDIAIIDILVCNPDRHTRNFGVWLESKSSTVASLYPIFDNGLGMGQWVQNTEWYETYEDYMREAYIGPYGEDPFELLKILDRHFNIIKKLKPYANNIASLGRLGFPNEFAKVYYHKIIETIRR